jgi:hypothetical protein
LNHLGFDWFPRQKVAKKLWRSSLNYNNVSIVFVCIQIPAYSCLSSVIDPDLYIIPPILIW